MDMAKLYLFNEQIAMQFASLSGLCEELLQFEAYAEKHNLSKANVLRKAVKELFERDEKK